MNEKLSFQYMADALSQRGNVQKKVAESFIKAFVDTVVEAVKEGEEVVKVEGFGTFKRVAVDSRESVNVSNGERIVIPGYTKLAFSPEDAVVEMLSNKGEKGSDETLGEDENDNVKEEEEALLDESPSLLNELIEVEEPSCVEQPKDEFSGIDMIISTPESVDDVRLQLEEATAKVAEAIETAKKASAEKARLERLLERLEKNVAPESAALTRLLSDTREVDSSNSLADGANASTSETNASTSGINASSSETNASSSETNASSSETNASSGNAHSSVKDTNTSEGNANTHTDNTSRRKGKRRWLTVLVCVLLVVGLLSGIGYLVYGTFLSIESVETVEMPKPKVRKDSKEHNEQKNNKDHKDNKDQKVATQEDAKKDDLSAKSDSVVNAIPVEQNKAAEAPSRPKTHVLKKGETLTRISKRYYGTKDSVRAIIRVNTFVNPDNVPAGAVIKLP